MSWTKEQLFQYARQNNLTLNELGRRGGRKAARIRKKQKRNQAQLTLAL